METSGPDDNAAPDPAELDGPRTGRRRRQVLHLVASVALLVATVWWVDPSSLASQMRALEPAWLLTGLALSVPMYLLLAARWWFTARRALAPLRFRRALLEMYMSTFLNQTLPLGVAGDALRAVRHGRRLRAGGDPRGLGRAVRTLLIERLGGLAALGLAVGLAAASLADRDRWLAGFAAIEALVIAIAVAAVAVAGGRRRIAGSALRELGQDARRALFARGALPAQLAMAAGVIASLIAIFYTAGRATGFGLDPLAVAQVAPIILAATTLPLAFAGWGVREAVTAAIWGALGLEPAAGAAIALTFGLLSLVASIPGLAVWLVARR
jgi:glycosyltransferase 2 family protein